MQTGCKNARASSRLRVPQLRAAAGRVSSGALAQWSEPVGNGLSRACLGAAPPLSLPLHDGCILARGHLGKRSVGNMKRLHLPGAAQTNFPKYPGFFGKEVRETRASATSKFHGFVL